MPSFDDLVNPLLIDPPRPAPSIDELRARVDERRRRRATALAACSIVAVLLIGTAALALPRDRGADVLAGPPGPTVGTTAPAPTTIPTPVPTSNLSWPSAPSDAVPPIEASDATFTFSPERAPLGQDRTLVIHSTTGSYRSCGSMDLLRWDGAEWHLVATSQFVANEDADRPTSTFHVGPPVGRDPCVPVPTPLDTDLRVHFPAPSSPVITEDALAPGWYQLYDGTARGRFAITSGGASGLGAPPSASDLAGAPNPATNPATASTTTSTTTTPVVATDVVTGTQRVELHPALDGSRSTSVEEVLPDHAIVIDDDTVSLTWRGGCPTPADHADVTGTTDAVSISLSVVVADLDQCAGPPARYLVTFDTPFAIGGRRVIVRAAGASDRLELTPKPAGSHLAPKELPGVGSETDEKTVTTLQLAIDDQSPSVDHPELRGLSCASWAAWILYEVDGFIVPRLHMEPAPSLVGACEPPTLTPAVGSSKVFPGLAPPDR